MARFSLEEAPPTRGRMPAHPKNRDKDTAAYDAYRQWQADQQVRRKQNEEVAKVYLEEKAKGIPAGILNSIAAVESQHSAYAVNAKRKSHKFKTKAEAVSFIKSTAQSGEKNISVGCLQLHYDTHKKHFASVDDMLSPKGNVAYAAMLLRSLYDRYGSWELAIKKYHSSKEQYSNLYYRKVMKAYGASRKFS